VLADGGLECGQQIDVGLAGADLGAQGIVAEIELQEQLPAFIGVIARGGTAPSIPRFAYPDAAWNAT
jgi:hypothetical protein